MFSGKNYLPKHNNTVFWKLMSSKTPYSCFLDSTVFNDASTNILPPYSGVEKEPNKGAGSSKFLFTQ
jgi:hypothetical protein